MTLFKNIRTYYVFFSCSFTLLSQSTLNLTYAQDIIVVVDDIESRVTVQKTKATFVLYTIEFENTFLEVSGTQEYVNDERVMPLWINVGTEAQLSEQGNKGKETYLFWNLVRTEKQKTSN